MKRIWETNKDHLYYAAHHRRFERWCLKRLFKPLYSNIKAIFRIKWWSLPCVFSGSLSTVKNRVGLKLRSWDKLNHKKLFKKRRILITHVAVIKSLTSRSVSSGCLLHLSLIWLLALIWGSRSLTGIQNSFCTRSAWTAASSKSTYALYGEPGEETLSNKVNPGTNTSFTLSSCLLLQRCSLPPFIQSLWVIKLNDSSLRRVTPLVFANDFHPSAYLVSRGLTH